MDPKLQALAAAAISFVIVGLIFFLIIFLCKKTTNSKRRLRKDPNPHFRNLSFIDDSASFDPSLSRISMPELIFATRNFSSENIIGDGSFGFVYRACFPSGVTVAVKKLSPDAFQGFREFRAEIETLGKISCKHPNLVRILGFCISGPDRLLIYDFFEKGSLDQWLQDNSESLSWAKRTQIIKGVASGISFLHNETNPRIIHRDIKASNILLDSGFEAHIADFGLARRVAGENSHVSTQVAGTMGYMPPEYWDGLPSAVATVKADVYSFGVLMVEVATGRRPNWPVASENGKDVRLVDWAKKMVEEEKYMKIIDESLLKDGRFGLEVGEEEEKVKKYFDIACLCTSKNSKERPTMDEVVLLLGGL